MDEFDNAEQLKELKQLLNAGHDAGRYALRYNNEKGESEKFRTYCPKVIASIGTLPGTLESRCLPIDMQRVPADAEKLLIEFCDLDEKRFQEFKRKTLAWIQDHWEEIKRARPIRPDWLKTRDWISGNRSLLLRTLWENGRSSGLNGPQPDYSKIVWWSNPSRSKSSSTYEELPSNRR